MRVAVRAVSSRSIGAAELSNIIALPPNSPLSAPATIGATITDGVL